MTATDPPALPDELLAIARDPEIRTVKFQGNRRDFLFRGSDCVGWIDWFPDGSDSFYGTPAIRLAAAYFARAAAKRACVDDLPAALDELT